MKTTFFFYVALILVCVSASRLEAQTARPSAADLVKQGQALNNEGKQDAAIALYQQAVQADPDNYEAHLAWGSALDLKGDYADARHHLTKAIGVAKPENKDQALRTMAFSYTFECNTAEAAKYEQQVFNAALAKPDFAAAAGIANELARIYLECGDTQNSFDWYKKGYDTALRKTDLSDADKNLWLFRWENAQARIAARKGEKDKAQKHVTAAKAALDKANNPDQAVFFPYLTGYVAFYGGDYKTAIADLQKANQHDPFILVLQAQAYDKSGDKTRAMEYYKKVLAINSHGPTNAFARPIARKNAGS